MRKRSKYRPKPVYANPLQYVLENHTLLCEHDDYALVWKTKNHVAMLTVTQGSATPRRDRHTDGGAQHHQGDDPHPGRSRD